MGKGPILSAPGLVLGIVAIIRNESPYLTEWLAFHRALGVQHVFLYDNGSDDALEEVIEPWVNHGLVTLVHWPLPGGQMDAYAHAVRFYGPSVEWLAFIDVDEFIIPLVDDDLPTLLARWPDAADVRVPRVDFGFSGHRAPPQALTIEAYTGVADVFGRDPAKPPRVKTIARPGSVSAVGIHTATVADHPFGADGRPVPHETVGSACHDFVQLNHYYTRSYEEFEAKRFRGSATGRIVRPALPFDLPTLREDRSALRFVARTQSVIEHMRSLAASPYHYGSQLDLVQFPHFNDLGLFTEFAIANVVMREPEPRREPRLRLDNRYGGTGFVADLAGLGHVPALGDLSRSVHLGPLVERARGRLEGSWADDPDEVPSLEEGRATAEDAGWRVEGADGAAATRFPVESGGARRCYAVGFVLQTGGAASLETALQGVEGRSLARADVPLEEATTYAGVVEIDPLPAVVSAVTVRLRSGAETLIHDLFVLSYG
jgi:hypothetical protein